ncbi:sulfur carrier protein adenylyltransferase [Geobacillus phage GR1]|nr:sulfur carrier protein adenylyltransferase [Geobacillus phage GR1]
MMKTYVVIMDELKNESGRIAKENLLKKYEDVPGLKEIFKFVFNPMIVTGLAKRKIEKKVNVSHEIELETIFDAMNFVKDNNTGNDLVIATVQNFLNKLKTEEEKELAKSILVKDLPIGISRTTLNKVYGNDFIEKYSVMLAGKYEPEKCDLSGGFNLTLKLDGNRITVFNYEDGPKFLARSGKEVEGLVELEEEFKKLPKNMVYDGEIIAVNKDNLPSKDLFNLTQTIVRRKGPKTGLNFVMFDMLPISEFNEGKSKKKYNERVNIDMEHMFNYEIHPESLIKKVPIYYTGTDESVIPKILSEVEEQGYEGLMINLLDSYYETKRSKGILKVKTFHTADLLCVGIKEDIRGNRCGSVTVDYKGFRVDVAGLKDEQKDLFWKHPETVVGKIIEVKYFEESKNSQGALSLRFPSFVRIREEKDLDDISYA